MAEQLGARQPLGPTPNMLRPGELPLGQWQLASPPAPCGACGDGGGDAAGQGPPKKRRSRNKALPNPADITPSLYAITAAVFILKDDGEGDVRLDMWQNLMRRALLLDRRVGRILDNSRLMTFIRKDTLLDDYLNTFPRASHAPPTRQISRRMCLRVEAEGAISVDPADEQDEELLTTFFHLLSRSFPSTISRPFFDSLLVPPPVLPPAPAAMPPPQPGNQELPLHALALAPLPRGAGDAAPGTPRTLPRERWAAAGSGRFGAGLVIPGADRALPYAAAALPPPLPPRPTEVDEQLASLRVACATLLDMAPSGEEDRTAFCETVDNLLSAVEALGALSWPQPRPGAGPLAVGAPEVDPTNPTKVRFPVSGSSSSQYLVQVKQEGPAQRGMKVGAVTSVPDVRQTSERIEVFAHALHQRHVAASAQVPGAQPAVVRGSGHNYLLFDLQPVLADDADMPSFDDSFAQFFCAADD